MNNLESIYTKHEKNVLDVEERICEPAKSINNLISFCKNLLTS